MAETTASAPAGPPPVRRYNRKKLLKAGPTGLAAMIIGLVGMIMFANSAAPTEAPPATGILAAAEAPDAGAYGGTDAGAYGGNSCPPVMFIAARGSGEAPQKNWANPSSYTSDKYQGFGRELWSLYVQLQQRSPAYIAFYPVIYPAANVFELIDGHYKLYEASVAQGAGAVVSDIRLIDAACHGVPHHFVLAGYSQGAWVIHDALHALATARPSKLGEISGVALFGDPDFLPLKPWVRDFKWLDLAIGSAALAGQGYAEFPAQVAPRTASYCLPTDPVCQTSPFNIEYFLPACAIGNPLCPHFLYVQLGEVTKAAKFLTPLLPS